jgi:hypothetical protein
MTKRHDPTDEQRRTVLNAAGYGLTEMQIATLIGVSDRMLRTKYKRELADGHVRCGYAVAKRLYELATGADSRTALTAAIFWCKARLNWREADAQSVNVNASATAQSAVLRIPVFAGDLEEWNKAAQEQQRQSMEQSRLIAENLQAGRPVLRPVPSNQPYGKSEIVELDVAATPRRRKWSQIPNPWCGG